MLKQVHNIWGLLQIRTCDTAWHWEKLRTTVEIYLLLQKTTTTSPNANASCSVWVFKSAQFQVTRGIRVKSLLLNVQEVEMVFTLSTVYRCMRTFIPSHNWRCRRSYQWNSLIRKQPGFTFEMGSRLWGESGTTAYFTCCRVDSCGAKLVRCSQVTGHRQWSDQLLTFLPRRRSAPYSSQLLTNFSYIALHLLAKALTTTLPPGAIAGSYADATPIFFHSFDAHFDSA